jgi:hypothetical protein
MTAATLAGRPDPFVSVLESLGSTARHVARLEAPITRVHKIVSAVDGVLDDLEQFRPLLTGIEGTLMGLQGVLALLSAVPVINAPVLACRGPVVAAVRGVDATRKAFASVDDRLIKPCRTAFHDIQLGLTEAHQVVHAISTTVPGYTNTLQILHFIAQSAAPLTEILKGSEPAEELGKLLRTLHDLEEEAAAALLPLANFLEGVEAVVRSIDEALEGVDDKMKSIMQPVRAGLQSVEDVFGPIADAFNAVANAVKPVRWALDALSWVFDNVCRPIIEAILKATGLEKMLDRLTDAVAEKLGIAPILNMVESSLKSQQAQQWQQRGGVQAAGSGRNAWGRLTGTLNRYSTRNSSAFSDHLTLLISAIAGTPIDPAKPAVIPDWPGHPNLRVPQGAGARGAAALVSLRAIPLQRVLRGQRLMREHLLVAAIPGPARPAPVRVDVPTVLAKSGVAGGIVSLDRLVSLATRASTELASAATLGSGLVADLARYDAARALPGTFRECMQDVSDLLNDGIRILEFVEQFGVLTAFIENLKAPMDAQVGAIEEIVRASEDLIRSGRVMDEVVGQVINAVPSAGVFTDALHYMDEVGLGAASLSAAMARARELDSRLNNAHHAQLEALQSQLETGVAQLTAQTTRVETLAQEALAAGRTVHRVLQAYAGGLSRLSRDADLISSDALPSLTEGVHLLNTLAAILDPLSALLRKLDCVPGDDPAIKVAAGAIVQTFKSGVSATVDAQDQALRTLFGVVLSSAIHTGRMTADVQAINALVQKEQAGFDQARTRLGASLAALAGAMKPARAFPATDQKGSPVTVHNLFVDPLFASQAQAVFDSIQKAAREAGLIPGAA